MLGCKKHLFDYRTKYVGEYDFIIHENSAIYTRGGTDTTYFSKGKIWYDTDKKSILISAQTLNFRATVFEDGTLEGLDNNGGGEFLSKKEVAYSRSWGSPAARMAWDLKGEKK